MKKILLLASFVFALAFCNAQSYHVDYNDSPVAENDTITVVSNEEEYSMFFSVTVNNTTSLKTIYSTQSMNNSGIIITSICAGYFCVSNTEMSESFATRPLTLDPGEHDDNHIEFYIPEDANNGIFKFKIYDSENSSDSFTFYIKVKNGNVGISTINADNMQLSLYPNPATDMVNLTLGDNEEGAKASLFNLAGQKVRETVITAGTTHATMNVADLPKGTYSIQITNLNGTLRGNSLVVIK